LSRAAVTAVTFGLALLLLPPWIPGMPAPDLDSSWALALGYAFNHGWQFGKDIVFTYGPYGFLYGKLFDPDYYSLSLGIWLVFAATFGFAVSALLDGVRPVGRLLAVAALFVALRSGTWGVLYFSDPFFFLVPLTFALIAFDPRRIGMRGLAPALLALSALAGLIKFTYLLFGFTCVVLADLHRLRRRALPWYTVGYLLSVLAFFALSGQRLGNFPTYLRTSLAVTAGYSEAMQTSGATVELLGFAVVASSFLLLVLRYQRASADWKDNRWLGAIPFLAWVAFFFIVFKAAFVRHDPHVEIGWSSAAAAIALYTPRVWSMQSLRAERAALVFLSLVALGVAIARHCRNDHESFGNFLNRNFGSGLLERIDAIGKVALGQHRAQQMQRYEAALAMIRARSPMPMTLGTVDAMPWDAAGVIANRLQYHPRPVFESFSAYNQLLMDLNRSFLRSDDAPSLIVFDVAPIDDRFPAQDDGALWPDLIARYDAQETTGGRLLLTRRPSPRPMRLTPIAPPAVARWDTPVLVPGTAPLVWVRLDVRKTVLGRLVDFVFKLPVIELSITLEDGTAIQHRLVPDVARSGFLLSPVVDSGRAFARLLHKDPATLEPTRHVVSVQVLAPDGISWLYDQSVQFDFRELSFDAPP
jgi:hypothetical protein